MSNLIEWGFANTPTKFITKAEALETTVSKLRNVLNVHPDHEISIYNHAANQSVNNDGANSDSISDSSNTPTVPKRAKKTKPVEKTTELLDLPTVLDDVDPESDVL